MVRKFPVATAFQTSSPRKYQKILQVLTLLLQKSVQTDRRTSVWTNGIFFFKRNSLMRSSTVFTTLVAINFMNFLDRGIIPGSIEEFNMFIKSTIMTNSPDVFLGILVHQIISSYLHILYR